jgi:hypothetical protein
MGGGGLHCTLYSKTVKFIHIINSLLTGLAGPAVKDLRISISPAHMARKVRTIVYSAGILKQYGN